MQQVEEVPSEEQMDNLAPVEPAVELAVELAVEKALAESAPEPAVLNQPPPDYSNLVQTCEKIAVYYERTFKNLRFSTPTQIHDGCVVEFIDPKMDVVVASARLRYRNIVHVDKTSGNLLVEAVLSDLAFGRSHIELSLK